jgi:LysR family transcriptional regulator, cell division regulator
MNTNDLKIFEAVAQTGSFTKAAELTATVQSNITARIKSLEDEFGVQLFTRTSRKVELTTAGEKLIAYSHQISDLISAAKEELRQSDQVIGHLKIGCIETTMALKAPEMIRSFHELYPDVSLEFRAAMRSTLLNEVLQYQLDAAFVTAPVYAPELAHIPIKDEKLAILASTKYRTVNELLKQPTPTIIVFEQGCAFRERLETWLASKGISKYKSIVVNSLEGIINFVEAGLGISIMGTDVINEYYSSRNITTFPMTKELATMSTLLVYRNKSRLSPALKAFIKLYQ